MIDFTDVRKEYPNGTVALHDINLKIEDGEFVFIVGDNGAGKSTLLKLLLREEQVTDGTIFVNDYDLVRIQNRKIPYYRRQIGVVYQDFKLFDKRTVYENVAFAMLAIGKSNREIKRRVPDFLTAMGLEDKRDSFPGQLSGGEQQRVSLARALINNPKILIADEPTANIDPRFSLDIMNLLTRINRGGRTVIVITHERALVDYFKKRVVRLEKGTIVTDVAGGTYNA